LKQASVDIAGMELYRPREAPWFSNELLGVWAISVCGVIIGGVLGWVALRIGLCENARSADSATYCNDGGWEASGVGVAGAIGLALALPVLALATDRCLLFRLGLVLPAAVLAADIGLSLAVAIP
jgi:hypothetical protein